MPQTGREAPLVRLELRHGNARPTLHDVSGEEFLIGSVPGCDLRIPGANLPPIICQIVRRSDGVRLRKLAPTQPILLNGQPVVTQAALAHGDSVLIGAVELRVQLALPEVPARRQPEAAPGIAFVPISAPPAQAMPKIGPSDFQAPARIVHEPANVWQQYQQEVVQFREQVARFEEQRRLLEEKRRQLEEHEHELEADRVIWYRRREEIEKECREQTERSNEFEARLRSEQNSISEQRAALELERHSMSTHERQLQVDSRQVQDLRLQLQNQQAQLDSQIREFMAKVQSFQPRLDELEAREKAVRNKETQLTPLAETLANDRRWHESQLAERQKQLDAREAELRAREERLAADAQAVQQMQGQYQADLIRVDRRSATFEQREQEMLARQAEIEQRYEQMQRDARELEEQARLLDGGQVRLRDEAARLARQKTEQDAMAASLAERTATLEGQQAMLATLRTRMERLREELRQQAQQLAAERANQESIVAQIRQRLEEADKLKGELDNESRSREHERATFSERNAALLTAVARIRELQERLDAENKRLEEKGQQLDAQAAEQAEQTAMIRARAQQLLEAQQRVEADRQSLRDRDAALSQSEEARKALQEQLLRRGEELTSQVSALEERAKLVAAKEAELSRLRDQLEVDRLKGDEQINTLKGDIEARSAEIQRLSAALTQREDTLLRQMERLKEAGQNIAAERKSMFESKVRWEAEQVAAAEALARSRTELEAFRKETIGQASELTRALPELEIRSQGALERLGQSRDQLRGHLQELHGYARQSQEDLQELRDQVQAEADRLRQQELALHRARSEHRLSVTAFRQQLIDWQGRVAEMKQFFSQNETRLDLKQQMIEAAAKEIDASTRQLARQSETLQQQQREVAERKTEVERHLGDMREWYRKKLRDLAGGPARNYTGGVLEMPSANAVNDPAPPKSGNEGGRDILSLTGDVDPADRKLGELLLQLGLVDQETLIPLWNESRRQRRSLRQVLLTSGTITLYQMALIEAGNVDRLMLGSYRVIDRVQASSREVLYRVFDPDRNGLALLRHLAEGEMSDAVHPDDYRQRFGAAAAISHPNLSATYGVLEINGRPAVLQEWVSGLPSSDWPAFAAAPGVWYRLLGQAGLGMQAAHSAGLTHGHITNHSIILTADGVVKLVGFGEPNWLVGLDEPANGVAADLESLGKLASEWSMLMPKVKRGKPKPLADDLQTVVRRLGGAAFAGLDRADNPILIPAFEVDERYASITAMLEDLETAGAELPQNAEAWDRLVKHVTENATEGAALRQTA
jgi:chromosome segregation ATPase